MNGMRTDGWCTCTHLCACAVEDSLHLECILVKHMHPSCVCVLCVSGVLSVQVAFVADRHPMSPAWVHDFAATDKYAIIIEHPLYMQLGSLLLNTPATHIFSKCWCVHA